MCADANAVVGLRCEEVGRYDGCGVYRIRLSELAAVWFGGRVLVVSLIAGLNN